MKTYQKRLLVALLVLCSSAFLQWVSGAPFQRSPNEAFFIAGSLLFALMFYFNPFMDD